MTWTDVTRWTGDVVDHRMRQRLESRRDVCWTFGGEVRFCGVDREWLRRLGVIG